MAPADDIVDAVGDDEFDDEDEVAECTIEDIHVGSVVREAELYVSSEGAYFDYLELAD